MWCFPLVLVSSIWVEEQICPGNDRFCGRYHLSGMRTWCFAVQSSPYLCIAMLLLALEFHLNRQEWVRMMNPSIIQKRGFVVNFSSVIHGRGSRKRHGTKFRLLLHVLLHRWNRRIMPEAHGRFGSWVSLSSIHISWFTRFLILGYYLCVLHLSACYYASFDDTYWFGFVDTYTWN